MVQGGGHTATAAAPAAIDGDVGVLPLSQPVVGGDKGGKKKRVLPDSMQNQQGAAHQQQQAGQPADNLGSYQLKKAKPEVMDLVAPASGGTGGGGGGGGGLSDEQRQKIEENRRKAMEKVCCVVCLPSTVCPQLT